MEKSNIVLIGMPGVGKSSVGVVLAKILGKGFVDVDLLIQRACGETLEKIIDSKGAEGFIEIENRVMREMDVRDTVISTGGSAVYSDEAMRHLSDIGMIVFLTMPCEELHERLGELRERGVVMREGPGMSLQDLYDEREPLYERYAEITVEVSGLTLREAALRLARQLAD